MKNSSDSTSTKCLSGILRSLLCTGSLPTHPADQFIEPGQKQIDDQKLEKAFEFEIETDGKKTASSSTPGVVARLMGLDSFPDISFPPKQKTLGSYFRSRSANSIDFFSQFDPIKPACMHRRVRTSVSFREVPSLLHDKFSVVFPLEEVNETAEYQEEFLTMKRPKLNYQQGKEEKWGTSKNTENLEEKSVKQKKPGKKLEMEGLKRSVCVKLHSGVGNVASQKKDFHGKTSMNLKERRAVNSNKERKPIIKPVKKKKVHAAKKIHPEATVKEASRAMCSNKHASSQTARPQRTYSSGPHKSNGEVRAIIKGKAERKFKKDGSSCYKNTGKEMLRLTQECADEISSDWMYGQILKFEDFEDICLQFGQRILETLLYQIVDELLLL